MRRTINHLSALVLSMLVSIGAWALEPVNGVYQIGTAADLAEFAELVAAGEGDVNLDAVLTADIDFTEYKQTVIGTNTAFFGGTFDGQFHTITVDIQMDMGEYMTLFTRVSGTIRNLRVEGNVMAYAKYTSGLVGQIRGDHALIENVVSNVTITTPIVGDCTNGGLIGRTQSADTKCLVRNSAFTGAFVGPDATCWGGFCGWAEGSLTFENCMMIADVSQTKTQDGHTFARHPEVVTLKNCIYLNPIAGAFAPEAAVQVTPEELMTGAACYRLNGLSSENPHWFQNLEGDVDDLPVPDPTHSAVYQNGRAHCNGDAYEDETIFSNSNEGIIKDNHDMHGGLCAYCHLLDKEYMQPSEDGYYDLGTAEQLTWFAYLVNSGESTLKARLTAPIDLEGFDYPAIGCAAKPYKGTFDGRLFPVTNLSVPFFGTTDAAKINGIAIESANIIGRRKDIADHTGSIVGVGNNNTSITNSYSNAVIVLGNEGDLGGLVGKFSGPITNCAFYGTAQSSGWSHAGFAGSGGQTLIISDCIMGGTLISTGGEAKGLMVGWSDGPTMTNCVAIAQALNFEKLYGVDANPGTKPTIMNDCAVMDAEQIASGAATWKLNHKTFTDATWYQTIGEDERPVLDNTHGLVYELEDETYTCNIDEIVEALAAEATDYIDGIVAYSGDIEAYNAALEDLKTATTAEDLLQKYDALQAAKQNVEVSRKAYDRYDQRILTIRDYCEEHTMEGTEYDLLQAYLDEDAIAPSEEFPNGNYGYILENMQLTAEAIALEGDFAEALLAEAIKAQVNPGDEVTRLIANADLASSVKFEGWTYTNKSQGFSTGGAPGCLRAAECWDGTFNMHQTLSGMKNGVYELRVNAATRVAANGYTGNDNYIGYLYANGYEVNVMSLGDDMVSEAEAVDGVNCYITEGASLTDNHFDDGEREGYVPVGIGGCSIAFTAGRYENRLLCRVEDGTLTLGLRMDGSGHQYDWMGFGNFRLFYLGALEEAPELMNQGVDAVCKRAQALIDYKASGVLDEKDGVPYNVQPNFSAELRQQLAQTIAQAQAATTGADKLKAMQTMTDLFHQIDQCKQAYIEYLNFAYSLYNGVSANPDATDQDVEEVENAFINILAKWMAGEYTYEEALAMEDIKSTNYYQRMNEGAPEIEDGQYLIASVNNLLWVAKSVSAGSANISCLVTAPLDLEGVEFTSIGTADIPFTGVFDGGMQPITHLGKSLFGNASGATLRNIAIESGDVVGTSGFSGTLANDARRTTIDRCYSKATLTSAGNDCGGLVGKFTGSITNSFFAGTFASGISVWTQGGLVGSSEGAGTVTIADCVMAGHIKTNGGNAKGALIGWDHGNNPMTNCYIIADCGNANIYGDGSNHGPFTGTQFVDADFLASGEATYLLNHEQTEDVAWFQTLGEDPLPTLIPTHAVVYCVDGQYTNDDPTAIEDIFSNDNDDDNRTRKVLVGGRLLIIQQGRVYDLQGRMLKR